MPKNYSLIVKYKVYYYFPLPHSIMGEGEQHGIVPQFAKELFERVEGTIDDEVMTR